MGGVGFTFAGWLLTAKGFTKATMPAKIAAIKADARTRYGPDFDKP